jgi:hypothetical protein
MACYRDSFTFDTVTWRLKDGRVEEEKTSVARELLCGQASTATEICDRLNRHKCSNGGTVGGGVLYAVCADFLQGEPIGALK